MKTNFKLKKYLAVFAFSALAIITVYAGNKVFFNTKENNQFNYPRVKVEEVTIASSSTAVNTKRIKLALLLDTSNSMDGLIEQAKSQLWAIVNEMAKAKCDAEKPSIEIALYEYGNDRLAMQEGYIRQVTPFTSDLDKISQELFSLTTNGGSEFCGHVIQTALKQLTWSPDGNDLQVIFIAGNEPFNQGSVNYKEACTEAAKKNVIVNTIFCGNFNEGINTFWKNGSDIGLGSYMSIEQNQKTVYIPSPYDDKINQLNSQLNSTYIEYGNEGKVKKEMQEKQDSNAGSYGKENSVNRAISKSSHVYKNKSWDLVDAADEEDFKVASVPQSQLPDNMKNMTTEQKEKYISDKKNERERIKTEISELSKQREKYIAEQKQKSGESEKTLDKTMIESIRKQATQKNFKF